MQLQLFTPVFRTNASKLLLSALLVTGLFQAARAEEPNTVSPYEEQAKLIRAPRALGTLGEDLFGDKVNYYSGSLEFVQNDVTLPGNSTLPVAIGRRVRTGAWPFGTTHFGGWDMEIPHLHGMFSKARGWDTSTESLLRCSQFSPPSDRRGSQGSTSIWKGTEFWHGSFLYIPGVGDQELLRRSEHYASAPNGQTGAYPVVTSKLGGAQRFEFDQANRLKSAVGKGTYVYDGLGRRVSTVGSDGVNRISVYNQEGKLMFMGVAGTPQESGHKYVYLHNHMIAEVGGNGGVIYMHTDGLGSPVATTDYQGKIVSRTRYEPYGATADGATGTIGFTGHVNAGDLGLVYMQQRFYDPVAGRFLSIDPVTTDANTGSSFNRYTYALNNPYKYIDPDGRQEHAAEAFGNQFRNDVASGNAAVYAPFQPVAVGVTGAMIVLPAAVAVGPSALAAVKNIPAAKIRAVAKIVWELKKLTGETPSVAKLASNTVKQVVTTIKHTSNTSKPQSAAAPPNPPPPPIPTP